MKKIINGLFLFMLGGLVATIGFEVYLRAIETTGAWRLLPAAEVSLYAPDPDSGYTHRAGASGIWLTENRATVSINSQGYRSNGSLSTADKKVAVLGNSFVEALQMRDDQTFSARAEKTLPGTQVMNWGIAGANPAVMNARLKNLGALHKPDHAYIFTTLLTILNSIDNDAGGTVAAYGIKDDQPALMYPYLKTRGFKFRNSAAGQFVYGLIDNFRIFTLLNNRKNRGMLDEWPKTQMVSAFTSRSCDTQAFEEFLNIQSSRRKMVNLFIHDLSKISHAQKIPVTVLTYEDSDPCAAGISGKARTAFISLLKDNGINYIDMQPQIDVRNVRIRDLQGFGATAGHGHFNRRGHALFGEILHDIIAKDMN